MAAVLQRLPKPLRDWGPVLLVVLVAFGIAEGLQAWRHGQQEAFVRALRELAAPGDIQMLGSVNCVYCVRARQWLESERVPYRECLIEKDADCERRYRATGAQGTPTFVVAGRSVVVGFDPERLLSALQRAKAAPKS